MGKGQPQEVACAKRSADPENEIGSKHWRGRQGGGVEVEEEEEKEVGFHWRSTPEKLHKKAHDSNRLAEEEEARKKKKKENET